MLSKGFLSEQAQPVEGEIDRQGREADAQF